MMYSPKTIINLPVARILLFPVIALLVFTSCSRRIHAKGPVEKYLDIMPPATLSTISVPISIPIPVLQNSVNQQIKGSLYALNNLSYTGAESFSMKVWKQAPILIRGWRGDQFEVTVPVRTWLKGSIDTDILGLKIKKSTTANLGMRIRLATKITLDGGWQVNTTTRILGYQWTKAPAVYLGPIKIPMSFLANKLIDSQLKYIGKRLDAEIKKQVKIRHMLSKIWQEVQTPFLVSKEHNTWVVLEPKNLMMTPINTRNQTLNTMVGVRGYASALVGSKPVSLPKQPLPQLTLKKSLNSEFKIYLQSSIDKSYVIKLAKKNFLNQTFRSGKRKVKVIGLNLYGSGKKLVIQAQLKGSLNGTVYLSGTPSYDAKQKNIVINDLDFSVDTRNKLAKMANWLFHRRIIRKIKTAIQVPVKAKLEETLTEARKALNNYKVSPGVHLQGTIHDLHIEKVFMKPKSIVTWVLASGKIAVLLKGL
ncbi:DUF4403 family protein [Microscilla marina]|uniref:Lipoprotein, putative n=1 Tax=Microscilla marina ATCC 23134 TaxID=313606 RepID=A1ZZ95_MICM2|nr:DUF4403 family protein [Microscilla marina]EAY24296.1 lipoprotein, putative [Microscilla marina ATCC 23134]